MKLPERFPVTITKGSARVKIYRSRNTKRGRTYEEFKVGYYDSTGKRKLQTFADYSDARKAADSVNAVITSGNIDGLTLTKSENLIYARAIEALRDSGVTLDQAALEFAEAKR